MTNCQNKSKAIWFSVSLGLSLGLAGIAHAQSQADIQELDEIDLGSEINKTKPMPYFGAPDVPNIYRDQATGGALVITPGPYLTPGTVEADPFREEPIPSFYEDGNIFSTTSDEAEADASQDASPFDLGIVEGQLAEIEPATLGLLEERTGGLPYHMWSGSNYERVVRVISNLPVATPSPTINELSELLILSSAAVPLRHHQVNPVVDPENKKTDGAYLDMDSFEAEPVYDNNSLLLARLMRLSETGKIDVFSDFLNALPQNLDLPELRELRVKNALLSGDILSACNLAEDARAEEGATNWLKILTYCRAIDGDRSGVNFNISLLQETNEASASFVDFINDVLSWSTGNPTLHRTSVVRPDILDPLTIAMINTTKRELPFDVVETMPRLYLGSMTRRADLSIDFRAEVSELAALYGVMDGRVFSEVLEAMEFTDGERDSIFLLANSGLGARVDGLLINSAMSEQDRLRKAELISTAYERGLREKIYPALSSPLLDAVKTMTPSADLAFFAHDAGRIALYSGDWLTAKKWYDLLLSTASQENFEANRSLISLWPLMLMSDNGGAIPANNEIINLWQQSLSQLPGAEKQRRQDLLFAMLDVFQYDVLTDSWADHSLDGYVSKMPNHVVWQEFLYSARAGRVGETLALGLMVLGDGWVDEVNVSVLSSVLSVFKSMGLEEEARSLAVEAMIGNGF